MSVEKLYSNENFNKVTQENKPFTQLLNIVIQNIKDPLSGYIWVYLSTLPPDWAVNKEQIKNKFRLGNATLKRIFSYLQRANLIQYHRERFKSGKLGDVAIHVLCGFNFNINEPYILTTGSKNDPMVLTTGSISHPVADQTSGSGLLQRRYRNTNKQKDKNKIKSFYENEKKHPFANSMNQMASETSHIKENEKNKRAPMPDNLKEQVKRIKRTI